MVGQENGKSVDLPSKVFECLRGISVSYTHLDVYKRQIFKRPKIRPYMTDNYYDALLRQAKAEKEVENIVRFSQKERAGDVYKRQVYDLDENGERIKLPSGRWKSHKEDTVDWNDQKYCEIWRHEWEAVSYTHLRSCSS